MKSVIGAVLLPWTLSAQMSVAVNASPDRPAPLGTPITWTAVVSGAVSGTLEYRFRVQRVGADFHTIVDYGPNSSLTWTTIDAEGTYQVEASVKNTTTREEADSTATQVFTALASRSPLISASAKPMVFIYSAPPCEMGGRMKVQFQAATAAPQSTTYKACSGLSMNFYLAGMIPGAQYSIQHTIEHSRTRTLGQVVTFTPGHGSVNGPTFTALSRSVPVPSGLLLQSLFGTPTIATDLNGQ